MRRSVAMMCLGALLLSAILSLSACSDDGPSRPRDDNPTRVVAELEGAVDGVPLVADQPTEVVFTLQLPPDVASVSAAAIDIEATLDHVRIDGIPLWRLIARKAGHLLGLDEELGATAYFRIGDDAATVCSQGSLYGPFAVSHGASLTVEPPTASADEATLEVINLGAMSVCMVITANFDGTLSVDGIALDLAEGSCASPADFAGTWSGTYECGNNCGSPFGDAIVLSVTQDGRQASYTDDGGYTFTGRVCGDTFRFEHVGEDFIERGTLTLTGPDTAIKRSTWRNTSPPFCWGDCVDYLSRGDTAECPPLTLTGGAPPNATVGQFYSYSAMTSGGVGNVTIWVTTPQEIPGLEAIEGGILAGTPTAEAVGSWQVNVTAYDACPNGAQIANASYTLTIAE